AKRSISPHTSSVSLRLTASPQGEALGAPAPVQHIDKSQFPVLALCECSGRNRDFAQEQI
ncbi:MAG: hypothetical protein ACI4PT_02340, partial [Candidatus Avoscillospira sp.]